MQKMPQIILGASIYLLEEEYKLGYGISVGFSNLNYSWCSV